MGKGTCSHEGCIKSVQKGGVCIAHGAKVRARKQCRIKGCTNQFQKGGVCVTHGAKRRLCSVEGCTNYPQKGGVCIAHGAVTTRCNFEGCTNGAVKGGVCITHGAKRKLCSFEGCTKGVQKGGVCWTHGAKVPHKQCSFEGGCTNQAKKGGVCITHGAEKKRCSYHEGCNKQVQKGRLCKGHYRVITNTANPPSSSSGANSTSDTTTTTTTTEEEENHGNVGDRGGDNAHKSPVQPSTKRRKVDKQITPRKKSHATKRKSAWQMNQKKRAKADEAMAAEEVNEPTNHASPSDLLPDTSMNPDTSIHDLDDHNHGIPNSILEKYDETNQDVVGAKAADAVQGEDCEIDDSTKSTVDHPLEPADTLGPGQLEEQQDIIFEYNVENLEAIDEVVEDLHTAENSDIKDKSAVDIEEMIARDAVEQSSLNDRDDNQDEVGENMLQKPESDFVIDELQPYKTNHGLDDKQDEVGEDMQGEDCQSDEVESDRTGLSDDQGVTLDGNVQPLHPREGGSKDIYGAKRGSVDQLIRLHAEEIPQVNAVRHDPDLNSMNNKSIDCDDDISGITPSTSISAVEETQVDEEDHNDVSNRGGDGPLDFVANNLINSANQGNDEEIQDMITEAVAQTYQTTIEDTEQGIELADYNQKHYQNYLERMQREGEIQGEADELNIDENVEEDVSNFDAPTTAPIALVSPPPAMSATTTAPTFAARRKRRQRGRNQHSILNALHSSDTSMVPPPTSLNEQRQSSNVARASTSVVPNSAAISSYQHDHHDLRRGVRRNLAAANTGMYHDDFLSDSDDEDFDPNDPDRGVIVARRRGLRQSSRRSVRPRYARDLYSTSIVLNPEELPEEHRECSICFNEFNQNQQRAVLPCFHGFHPACIDPWFWEKNTCPNCRFSLT